MNITLKNSLQTVLITTVSMLLVATVVQAAWSGPSGTAPANNTPAPINVGSDDQTKGGQITTENNATYGLITADGAGVLNAVVKDEEGSINVNDMYIRSIDRWVSELQSVLPPPPPPPDYITPQYSMPGGRGPNCQTHTVTIPSGQAGHVSVREYVRWYDHGWYALNIPRSTSGQTTWTSRNYCIHQGGLIIYTFKY